MDRKGVRQEGSKGVEEVVRELGQRGALYVEICHGEAR